ncbi:MAG: hypothetical protein LBK94_03020 [Prevotellaceae bacterium]|nr:hypothetical protein [Prevotellaceae bacterium]
MQSRRRMPGTGRYPANERNAGRGKPEAFAMKLFIGHRTQTVSQLI